MKIDLKELDYETLEGLYEQKAKKQREYSSKYFALKWRKDLTKEEEKRLLQIDKRYKDYQLEAITVREELIARKKGVFKEKAESLEDKPIAVKWGPWGPSLAHIVHPDLDRSMCGAYKSHLTYNGNLSAPPWFSTHYTQIDLNPDPGRVCKNCLSAWNKRHKKLLLEKARAMILSDMRKALKTQGIAKEQIDTLIGLVE